MTEIDVYQWIQNAFHSSALLQNVRLVTFSDTETESNCVMVEIHNHGRNCFSVFMKLVSEYCGQKQAVEMAREIRDVFMSRDGLSWRELSQNKPNPYHLSFKAKYIQEVTI